MKKYILFSIITLITIQISYSQQLNYVDFINTEITLFSENTNKFWYFNLLDENKFQDHLSHFELEKPDNLRTVKGDAEWSITDNIIFISHGYYTIHIPIDKAYARYKNNASEVEDWKILEIKNQTFLWVYNSISAQVKKSVEWKLLNWQKKGEFEKTIDYKLRVTNKSRDAKIKSFENIILDSLKFEFISEIKFDDFELSTYDADNEVFVLTSSIFGKFPVNIPMSEAKIFKSNFNYLTFSDVDVIIKDNVFTISKFMINNFGFPSYLYSLKDRLAYVDTEITYNFSEIEIYGIENYMGDVSTSISQSTISVGCKVDVDIPSNSKVNNRYALIIGNEDYTSYQSGLSTEQNVDFAENDARVFKEYALNALGVKEDNMYYLTNATSGQMKQRIALVSSILKQLGSKAELIFYYAGHGYPDELTKIPYLIPVDISANDLSGGINLLEVYKTFSETNASKVTVFLDACFTGGARNVGLVASRGIKISPKQDDLVGNIVVFSASSGAQSSLPYLEQGHGMFTYFLLDKLQKSNGKCSYSDLFNYLESEVSLHSLKVNEKIQSPKLSTSTTIQEKWIDWKF
jgi:hypothetical protein